VIINKESSAFIEIRATQWMVRSTVFDHNDSMIPRYGTSQEFPSSVERCPWKIYDKTHRCAWHIFNALQFFSISMQNIKIVFASNHIVRFRASRYFRIDFRSFTISLVMASEKIAMSYMCMCVLYVPCTILLQTIQGYRRCEIENKTEWCGRVFNDDFL